MEKLLTDPLVFVYRFRLALCPSFFGGFDLWDSG